jgi:hypothetical protein
MELHLYGKLFCPCLTQLLEILHIDISAPRCNCFFRGSGTNHQRRSCPSWVLWRNYCVWRREYLRTTSPCLSRSPTRFSDEVECRSRPSSGSDSKPTQFHGSVVLLTGKIYPDQDPGLRFGMARIKEKSQTWLRYRWA